MSNITKNLKCIVLRGGIEIWAEEERIQNLLSVLNSGIKKFVEIEGEVINPAEIIGIFSAIKMEESTRRKNGNWKCNKNYWHDKGQSCGHKIDYPTIQKLGLKK